MFSKREIFLFWVFIVLLVATACRFVLFPRFDNADGFNQAAKPAKLAPFDVNCRGEKIMTHLSNGSTLVTDGCGGGMILSASTTKRGAKKHSSAQKLASTVSLNSKKAVSRRIIEH